MIALEKLADLFNEKFLEISNLAKKLSLDLVLVGGVTRDFLLTGTLSDDIDVEVHRLDDHSYLKFKNELNKIGHASINQLNIITYNSSSGSLEFTPPRVEIYNGSMGHTNFKPEFKLKMPYKESFMRRDITINAIGFDLNNKITIDPYNGIHDLEHKIINTVSTDFSKDPVRFIRAVRFKTNFDFEYSPTIKNLMLDEQLKGLNSHHFFLEYKKAKNQNHFLKDIFTYFKNSFLTDYIDVPQIEIQDLNQLKLWFYLNNENSEYLTWIGASVKKYERALNVYQKKGKGIEKLSLADQDLLSRII